MIQRITFRPSAHHHHLSYVSKLSSIQLMGGSIEFTDGLNIIVGPNGSGKSSVLSVISHQLAANLTGYSEISTSWLRNATDIHGALNTSADIIHDGRPILYCCPREGISGLRDKIEEGDFMREIILDKYQSSCESTGEKSNRLLMPFIQSLLSDDEPSRTIMAASNTLDMNDVWMSRMARAQAEWLAPKIPLGKPTVIFDEPETGLSVLNQILLWNKVLKNPKVLSKYQLILVSHSPESLNIPGANYIELKPGYLDACRRALSGDFDESEIQRYASKINVHLQPEQLALLKRMSAAKSPLTYKGTDVQVSLVDLGFVELFRQKVMSSAPSGIKRGLRGYVTKDVMTLTSLGLQYLTLYANEK